MNFKNTVAGFKRLNGRKYKDADVQVWLCSEHLTECLGLLCG